MPGSIGLLHRCRWFVVVAIVTALPAMTAPPVRAGTDNVTTCNGSGAGSLPAVVTAATTGDTIVFSLNCPAASPITVTTAISVSKSLVIDGTGLTIVISGGGTTEIFTITSSGSLFLSDLTLRDGKAFLGGAIETAGSLSVTACTLVNNVTITGGGIFPGASVIFSSGGCTNVTVISATTLTCIVPAGTGTVDVTMNSGGGFVGKVGAYTYGAVTPLPAPGPTGGTPTGPKPLPNSRPAGSPSGSPAPLPPPRFA